MEMKSNNRERLLVKSTDKIISLSSGKNETIQLNSFSSNNVIIENFDGGLDKIDLSPFGELVYWLDENPDFIKQPNGSMSISDENGISIESGRRKLTILDNNGKKFEVLIKFSPASISPDWANNLSTGWALKDIELFDIASKLVEDTKDRKIEGSSDVDWLYGSIANNTLNGGAGNDRLDVSKSKGHNVLNGGTGDDIIFGGVGRNIYQFSRGDGRDTIYLHGNYSPNNPKSGQDILKFGEGITVKDVKLQKESNDLVISIIGTEDSVRFDNYYSQHDQKIGKIEFANGTIIDKAGIDGLIDASIAFSNLDRPRIERMLNSIGISSSSSTVEVDKLINAMAMFSNNQGSSSQIDNHSMANLSTMAAGYSYHGDFILPHK
ncbi:calcium-binding protein [Providencia burhodogranariea]|uniref:Bacteriocin n=1 Tax=Providencia burhodogranariea DSM 19968 TaxID=1141662 RepID=K8WMH3_9GAMM|nr:calcium-binding protein [Providencia burhodogranariea]EKT61181.1 bacteriocin [Providencia burhodogranariea DSM 19968]